MIRGAKVQHVDTQEDYNGLRGPTCGGGGVRSITTVLVESHVG